jgi:hypothetical protein
MVQFLQASQRPDPGPAAHGKRASTNVPSGTAPLASGGPLLIEKLDMRPARAAGANDAVLEVTFMVARVKRS